MALVADHGRRLTRTLTRLAHASRSLPTVTLQVSGTEGGQSVARALRRNRYAVGPWIPAVSVYDVPPNGRPFAGRSAHGRRSYVNRARRDGLVTAAVPPDEVDALLEHIGPGRRYCHGCSGLSYGAFDPEGGVIALSHLHWGEQVAQLVLSPHRDGDAWSGPARYALFEHVVSELADRGVRSLVVADTYFKLSEGLQEFQAVLGFTPVNVRLR